MKTVVNMFGYIQCGLPKRMLTRLAGFLAARRLGVVTRWCIRRFIEHFSVNMREAEESDWYCYPTFNAFFTRQLKSGMRPVDLRPEILVSPVDGQVGAMGRVRHGTLMQVKGRYYSIGALLANACGVVERFEGGHYLTAYLSPRDYHRVHMPLAGCLRQMTYVPGALFSVNQSSINAVDAVFARNERVICCFDTDHGEMLVVLVGAVIVGSMVTSWHGEVKSSHRTVMTVHYPPGEVKLEKGEELGYFQLGSTVVVITQPGLLDSMSVNSEDTLRMGQPIGSLLTSRVLT